MIDSRVMKLKRSPRAGWWVCFWSDDDTVPIWNEYMSVRGWFTMGMVVADVSNMGIGRTG